MYSLDEVKKIDPEIARAIEDEVQRQNDHIELIASGGIQNGVEAAKAIRLGANLAGFAARLLPAAAKNTEAVTEELKIIMHQYRIAMFLSSGIQKTEKHAK